MYRRRPIHYNVGPTVDVLATEMIRPNERERGKVGGKLKSEKEW